MFDLIMANFAKHITLDPEEADYVQSVLQHKVIKKNTVLLNSGDVSRFVYFVNRGCLRIYHTDSSGLEHNLSFSPENWWAVDIASFSGQRPAFYSISALEDGEVFCLSYEALENLYIQVPKFERFIRILTQNGFSMYQRRITSGMSKSAEERYRQFQKKYPYLEQRIAQKHIASYLGITPVFLSMLRRRT